jgi:hypothetical protein
MRVELITDSRSLRLSRGQALRLRDGAGSTICACEGRLWITEENRPSDVVLTPGECYRLQSGGIAVVEALREAALTLS